MTNRKTTRRALVLSLLSLLLCCSMLVGTTFAWFTDSVTSGKNTIVAGNLDIELKYSKDFIAWNTVEGATDLVDPNALWEPGRTEVVYLKLSNEGTLALKYSFAMTIANAIIGKSVEGNDIALADYLKYDIVDVTAAYADRDAARAAVESTAKALTDYTDAGFMLPGEAAKTMALVIYMPETVGNEANYRGEAIPTIELGLNLFATQKDAEFDSFGPDYDKDLTTGTYVSGLEEVRAALAAGGTVVLDEDIIFTDEDEAVNAFPGYSSAYPAMVQINKDTNLYLNGHDFAYAGTEEMYYLLHVTDGAVVNIYGDESTVLSSTDPAGTNAIAANRNSVVNIYGGVYTSNDVAVIDLNSGAVVNIYDGFFYAESFRNTSAQTNVLLNCTNNSNGGSFNVYGGTFVNADPSKAQDGNWVAEGYKVVAETKANGEIWYHVVPEDAAPVANVADLNSAIAAAQDGDTVVLISDVDFGGTQLTLAKDVTIDLNGNALTTSNNYGGITVNNGASIKNGTINHTGNTAAIKLLGNAGSIENVTINMTPTAGKTKTGIQVYNGKYVESIKNVTITGVTQGIEVAKGSRVDLIENVTVKAVDDGAKKGVGLLVNAASVGKAVGCTFEGSYGVYMMLNGEFHVALEMVDCTAVGGEAAVIAHDETGISNTTNCSLTLTYDAATKINGAFVWEFEDECLGVVTLNKP